MFILPVSRLKNVLLLDFTSAAVLMLCFFHKNNRAGTTMVPQRYHKTVGCCNAILLPLLRLGACETTILSAPLLCRDPERRFSPRLSSAETLLAHLNRACTPPPLASPSHLQTHANTHKRTKNEKYRRTSSSFIVILLHCTTFVRRHKHQAETF